MYETAQFEKDFQEDKRAKSPAYFARDYPVIVTAEKILTLEKILDERSCTSARICLHTDVLESYHNMIVAERRGACFPPHYHRDKGECFHVLKGALFVGLFGEDGVCSKKFILETGDFLRIPPGATHIVASLSERVVYHESKNGPHKKVGDAIFPAWVDQEMSRAEIFKLYVSQIGD